MRIVPIVSTLVLVLFVFPCVAAAAETIPAPGAKAASNAAEAKDEVAGEHIGYRTTVVGEKDVRESDPVGSYNQPVWTTARRFPTTRVYVIPAGGAAIEYWFITEGGITSGSQPSYESRLELEIGLGKRLQFDAYLIFGQSGYAAPLSLAAEELELRYAFADWGVLWGNPTLFLEWIRQNAGPQKLEGKLLLGGDMTNQWFWGVNLVYERAMGGDSEGEYGISAGVSRVLVENSVSIGLEVKAAFADVQGARFDFVEKKFLAGPSLQWKPIRGVHIDLVPMAGVKIEDETDPFYTVYFIIGKDL
jgi:hypothetical protein